MVNKIITQFEFLMINLILIVNLFELLIVKKIIRRVGFFSFYVMNFLTKNHESHL